MKKVYFTIDLEDVINKNSIKIGREIIILLSKFKILPIIFISGDIIRLLIKKTHRFTKEIETIKTLSEIGYHTITHFPPTPVEVSDVRDYSIAYNVCYSRETRTFSFKGKRITVMEGFYLLFNKYPTHVRFPGFSWTPPYLETLNSLGINTSFDIHPDGLPNIPSIFKRRKNMFIKPDCILWIDEIARNFSDFGEAKLTLDKYLNNRHLINIAIHPNRLCNREWWLDYYSNPKKLPRYSNKEIKKRIKLIENIIQFLKKETEIISSDKLLHSISHLTELRISRKKVKQIYDNAILWTVRRFNYYPKYLFDHFLEFFL